MSHSEDDEVSIASNQESNQDDPPEDDSSSLSVAPCDNAPEDDSSTDAPRDDDETVGDESNQPHNDNASAEGNQTMEEASDDEPTVTFYAQYDQIVVPVDIEQEGPFDPRFVDARTVMSAEFALQPSLVSHYSDGEVLAEEHVVRAGNARFYTYREICDFSEVNQSGCPTFGNCTDCGKAGPLGDYCVDCNISERKRGYAVLYYFPNRFPNGPGIMINAEWYSALVGKFTQPALAHRRVRWRKMPKRYVQEEDIIQDFRRLRNHGNLQLATMDYNHYFGDLPNAVRDERLW